MFGLNGWEIPALVLLALLFFGGKKLPELARGFGKSLRTFKEEMQKEDDDDDDDGTEIETVSEEPASRSKAKSSKSKTTKK